jgi:DNA-directed RNA polymerase subunit L
MESKFTVSIQQISEKDNQLIFRIAGNNKFGLDKSIVNAIRRTLISSIPSVAFRIDDNTKRDIIIRSNNTSLHNEYLIHRISLIPLYINPDNYHKDYLFRLKVSHTSELPYQFITAENIDMYELNDELKHKVKKYDDLSEFEKSDLNDKLSVPNVDNYNMDVPLSDKFKKKIFRPFEFRGNINYPLITELKNTNSTNLVEDIDLYGVPSISIAKENARWQGVSNAVYIFEHDEKQFESVVKEKIKLKNISDDKVSDFTNHLKIEDGERYFLRDSHNEPYSYLFTVESQHYKDNKELLIHACSIIKDDLTIIKENINNLLIKSPTSITLNIKSDFTFELVINEQDYTTINLLQAYISRYNINDDSFIQFCGSKKTHPLEDIMIMIFSINRDKKIMEYSEKQKTDILLTTIKECIDNIIEQFNNINKSILSTL